MFFFFYFLSRHRPASTGPEFLASQQLSLNVFIKHRVQSGASHFFLCSPKFAIHTSLLPPRPLYPEVARVKR